MNKTALTAIIIFAFIGSFAAGVQGSSLATASNWEPPWPDYPFITKSSPDILISSPNNFTNYEDTIPLNFTITYLQSYSYTDPNVGDTTSVSVTINWLGYRVDGGKIVTISGQNIPPFSDVPNPSFTLLNVSDLPAGKHKIEVIASFFWFSDNGLQQTGGTAKYDFSPIYFYNTPLIPSSSPQETEPFPTQSPEPQQPEPFSTILVIAASVTAIVVVIASLLVYFKKSRREVSQS